jgi:hypothetical protein
MRRKLASRQFYSTFPEQELHLNQQAERKLLDNVVTKMFIVDGRLNVGLDDLCWSW